MVHLLSGLVFSLANCAFVHADKSRDIRKKIAFLNLAHSYVIHSECSIRKSSPRELEHSHSCWKRALELGRVLSLLASRPLVWGVSSEK